MCRRRPALVLLVALLGGLGSSSVHAAEHALDWAETQTSHEAEHAGGDHAHAPCADGEVHALDCAVCIGLSGATAEAARPAPLVVDEARAWAVSEAHVEYRRAVAPARGPPAVA